MLGAFLYAYFISLILQKNNKSAAHILENILLESILKTNGNAIYSKLMEL